MAVSRRTAFRASLTGGAALVLGGSGAAALASSDGPESARPGDADGALRLLRQGNRRWRASASHHPNEDAARREELTGGQSPFATILGCSDSRVPPELVFDRGLGDLFTVRSAGQVPDPSVLGSVLYAVEHLETPLLVVLGHESCGAVSAAVEAHETGDVPQGHIGHLVERLLPVVESTPDDGGDFVDACVTANAEDIARRLREDEEIGGFARTGALRVVAARYELGTGAVTFLD
ncbi:carbonic anhydrase [Allosalinactinospora lopnorensis]|uniref:carbonic anhydrase n=1 Tax=Allosalinactinospora lopnorensis TaxID=1352348 RepID=UPI0015680F8E|nr:carbonic anhydrase [Allosalinactinospora lopnorensis]